MPRTISSWSFSRLDVFEQCAHRAKLAYLNRIPEPERGPLPPHLKEWPNERGDRIHKRAEDFVRGTGEFIPEMLHFKPEFEKLKHLFAQDPARVILEQMWCFNDAWEQVGEKDYENIWLRVKLDAIVFLSESEAVVIDYKTGKRFGNEIKHAAQGNLYQLAALLRFPQLRKVHVEFWYLDQNELPLQSFTRAQGLHFMRNWNDRGLKMTNEIEFKPSANGKTCFFCPYKTGLIGKFGPNGTGHCPHST